METGDFGKISCEKQESSFGPLFAALRHLLSFATHDEAMLLN